MRLLSFTKSSESASKKLLSRLSGREGSQQIIAVTKKSLNRAALEVCAISIIADSRWLSSSSRPRDVQASLNVAQTYPDGNVLMFVNEEGPTTLIRRMRR